MGRLRERIVPLHRTVRHTQHENSPRTKEFKFLTQVFVSTLIVVVLHRRICLRRKNSRVHSLLSGQEHPVFCGKNGSLQCLENHANALVHTYT